MLDHHIPKKLHYCWYGGKPLPDLALRCIESWKTFLPEYELKRWDERNSDLKINRYVELAYQAGQYAFVSDVMRLKVLHVEGGIYLDTDVEVLKSFDSFLHHDLFLGFESRDVVASCVIGAKKGHPFILKLLRKYQEQEFSEGKTGVERVPNTVMFSEELENLGLMFNNEKQTAGRITVYPKEIFCPKDYDQLSYEITENTCTIHHFRGSWYSSGTRFFMWVRLNMVQRFLPGLDSPLLRIYKKIVRSLRN